MVATKRPETTISLSWKIASHRGREYFCPRNSWHSETPRRRTTRLHTNRARYEFQTCENVVENSAKIPPKDDIKG